MRNSVRWVKIQESDFSGSFFCVGLDYSKILIYSISISDTKTHCKEYMELMRYLTVQMLEEYIHLSKSSIYKMVRTGTIPHIKKGTRTLFDRIEIDKWMAGVEPIDLPELPNL